jgi:hypothetical protein
VTQKSPRTVIWAYTAKVSNSYSWYTNYLYISPVNEIVVEEWYLVASLSVYTFRFIQPALIFLAYSYIAWTACISPHILKHRPLQYYSFIDISLLHYNTTCMTWLWCDDLISYTFPLEWSIWLLPFPHNTSHFAPVLRFPALCFDIIRCRHGLWTPRESFLQKSQTFGAWAGKLSRKFLGHLGYFWPNYTTFLIVIKRVGLLDQALT